MSENGDIYTAGKNFTLLPALTALTNSTSVPIKSNELKNHKRSCQYPLFHHNQASMIPLKNKGRYFLVVGGLGLLLFVFKNILNNWIVDGNTLNGDFQDQNRRRRSMKASY